jgi:GNAT superfamily N-acetyltransferase
MHDVLTDLSDRALATAIKANFYAFFACFERTPSVEFHREQALTRWRTRIPHPFFQGALVTEPAPGEEERLVRETIEHFAAHGEPGFCWWLGQGVDAAPWEEPLAGYGFTPDDDPPGMALALDDLAEPEAPAGLAITRVEDDDRLRVWNETFVAGYGLPEELGGAFGELLAEVGGGMRHYLGHLAGVPVAASSLFPAAGVAGIYNVAVLPEARGKGLGAALTVAALREARSLGYRAAVLQSSEMGYGVYRRLGFRHLCAMDHFVWLAGR